MASRRRPWPAPVDTERDGGRYFVPLLLPGRALEAELLTPFIVASVPAVFIGGYVKVSEQIYFIVLYTVLTLVAVSLLFFSRFLPETDACAAPASGRR